MSALVIFSMLNNFGFIDFLPNFHSHEIFLVKYFKFVVSCREVAEIFVVFLSPELQKVVGEYFSLFNASVLFH